MTKIPENFLNDPDVLHGYSEDGSGEVMVPEYLVRPSSVEEVKDAVAFCYRENIAVTPAGAQTNDTASSLTDCGVCLSTERMKSIIEINEDELYAIVEPGIYLGDLKRELVARDLFYPPDPTSENIATLGGTVATNASGSRSYKYGATNRYILGMEVVLPTSEVFEFKSVETTKTTTGSCSLSHLSDLWVGSEGIFGIFTKIKIKLKKGVPDAFILMSFFKSVEDLIAFAVAIDAGKYQGISPRAIEYMDNTCLALLKNSGKFPQVPQDAHAALIIEQEFDKGGDFDLSLDLWLSALESGRAMLENSLVAETPSKISEIRELRHYVPATVWEMGKDAASEGGRKVSTDWAVPLHRFQEMTVKAEKLCAEHGFSPERVFRYAHLGDGHPHYNFVPENHRELEIALQLRKALCALAVKLGGTVAGEHGIGKHRKELLALEQNTFKLNLFRALKRELDPKGIMAPGNII